MSSARKVRRHSCAAMSFVFLFKHSVNGNFVF
jgi:hypothetical protein